MKAKGWFKGYPNLVWGVFEDGALVCAFEHKGQAEMWISWQLIDGQTDSSYEIKKKN